LGRPFDVNLHCGNVACTRAQSHETVMRLNSCPRTSR
jgi:hypothetical protein